MSAGGRSYVTTSPRTKKDEEDEWLRHWNKFSGDPDSPVCKDLNSMFSRAIHSSRVSFSPRNLPFIWRAVSPKKERGRSPRRSWAKGRPGGTSKSQDSRPKPGRRSRSRSASPRRPRPRSTTPPRRVVTISPRQEVTAPTEAPKPSKGAIKDTAGSSKYTIPKLTTPRPYVPSPIIVAPKPSCSKTRDVSTSSSSSSSSSSSDAPPTNKEKIKLKIKRRKLSLQKLKLKQKKKSKKVKSASVCPSTRSPTPSGPPNTPGKDSPDVDLLLDTAESF